MQTDVYRSKRNDLCAWLFDNFGQEGEREYHYRKDAEDLIKFMTARGWVIAPGKLRPNGLKPVFNCPSDDCPLG